MNKRVGIAAILLALLLLTPLQTQRLTLVEVHDDNESPETNGSPTDQTHLDGPLAEAMPPLVFSPDGKANAT